jgi:hypothetical protein
MNAGMAMPEQRPQEWQRPQAGGGGGIGGGDVPARTGGGGGRGRDDEARRAFVRAMRRLADQGMTGDAVARPLTQLIQTVQRYVDAERSVLREHAAEIGFEAIDRFVDAMAADARRRGTPSPDAESFRVARVEVCPVYPLCPQATTTGGQ